MGVPLSLARLFLMVPVAALALTGSVAGQSTAPSQAIPKSHPAAKSGAAKAAIPRTADGHPDLSGAWSNATVTPLERPAELGNKEFFTPAEAAAFEKSSKKALSRDQRDSDGSRDVAGAYNEFWYDRGGAAKNLRTSLIFDPPNGRIPALKPEAQARVAAAAKYTAAHPADGPESRSLQERCLLTTASGPPMLPGVYNDNYEIVQTPDSIAILVEMIHDVRHVSMNGRPHLASNVRQWMGDSIGHWEGDTLVVDTANFAQTRMRGADENLHVIERFTRTDADTILYRFTVEDPTAFTSSWSGEIPMLKIAGPVFEYACHEGNYALVDILAGARADEKKAVRGGGSK